MFVVIEFHDKIVDTVHGLFPTLEEAEKFRRSRMYPEDFDCFLLIDINNT